jgi:hypothetical protein
MEIISLNKTAWAVYFRWLDNIRMDLVDVDGLMWTGLVWLRIETGVQLFEFGIEPSGSISCWETVEYANS